MRYMIPIILFSLMAQSAGGTEQPLTYDRIRLSVSASAEVENDTLVAVLYAQREGPASETLADDVNRNIAWGLERAKQIPEVKVQTLDYGTSPIYSKQTLTGWRVRQSIHLESRDAASVSKLVGELQERLAVRSIGYSISPESRRTAEDELIAEALTSFQKRAKLVTKQLGRSHYRLVKMDVDTTGAPVRPMFARAVAMAAEVQVSPPSLEAGTETLSVTVSGTIELQLK